MVSVTCGQWVVFTGYSSLQNTYYWMASYIQIAPVLLAEGGEFVRGTPGCPYLIK